MPNFNLTIPISSLFLMLLCLLITCFAFNLFLRSLSLNPLPSWADNMRLLFLSPWSWKGLLLFPSLVVLIRKTLHKSYYFMSILPRKMSTKRMALVSNQNLEASNDSQVMSVLDLPELALECILERLPPSALCNMAGVCTSLRERCVSDHLWERHMKLKWGGIIGPAAYKKWQGQIDSTKEMGSLKQEKQKGLVRLLSMFWLPSWITKPKVDVDHQESLKQRSLSPVDSIMSWYLALETGRFWFPAQVFNRENGHVGFMLSCYDADLSYDPLTDTFQARYPPHGTRAVAIERNVPWERLREPPIHTLPHHLHISDCLNDLRPGDHFEIQWRKNKEFPYGWWYGVVGHLELCDGNELYCRCHNSDTVILEFHQYTPGSRWRRTAINRKDHGEEGNQVDGFYGGIRKLYNSEEISRWKWLWPADVLE